MILVTGGAGFIGSHVCEALLKAGVQVAAIDNIDNYYDRREKLWNVAHLAKHRAFTLYEADVTDSDRMTRLLSDLLPTVVIHLAARVGVRDSITLPLAYDIVNSGGTINVLEACKKLRNIPKVVIASSSAVYGAGSKVPFTEHDTEGMPMSPYAVSKRSAELMASVYAQLYCMQILCLRFFTVYGPRQRPDLAIRKFVRLIDEELPVPIFGDGSSQRDYTYIDDVVSAILKAVQIKSKFDIINIGSAKPITLINALTAIERQVGKRAIVYEHEEQAGDMGMTFADITKARILLQYEPKTSFEDGLASYVEWYRCRQSREG